MIVFAGGVLWLAKDLGAAPALAVGLYPFLFVDAIKSGSFGDRAAGGVAHD